MESHSTIIKYIALQEIVQVAHVELQRFKLHYQGRD